MCKKKEGVALLEQLLYTTPATPPQLSFLVHGREESIAVSGDGLYHLSPHHSIHNYLPSNIDWTPRPRSSSHDLTCFSSRPNWRQLCPCWEGLKGNHERQRACANTACSKARQIGMKYTKKDPRSRFLLYACYRSLAGKAFGHDTGIYIFKGV